jgi:hypothetical protein
MTVTTEFFDYLERPYLNDNDPYLTGAAARAGMQALFVINDQMSNGMQASFVIDEQDSNGMESEFLIDEQDVNAMQAEFMINFEESFGMESEFITSVDYQNGFQANFTIDSGEDISGFQSNFSVIDSKIAAMQALFIPDVGTTNAMQALFEIIDSQQSNGMEAKFDKLFHHLCQGYLEGGYLDDPYLTEIYCAMMGMQSEFNLFVTKKMGMQAEFIIEAQPTKGMQSEFMIDEQYPNGMQAGFLIAEEDNNAMQALFTINQDIQIGMQSLFIIEREVPIGMQADFVRNFPMGMQALFSLYNVTNLRILCTFPSRGASSGAGNNAWGNPIATGQNWKSNSTEPGDFEVYRLNTDVTEEFWRTASGVKTGINLDCDTEIAQGVFLDTLGVLEHNLTTSANVVLLGSNVSNFSTIGITITPIIVEDNFYWVSPDLPNQGFRYWRFQIDDPTNQDNFIKIGTIVFGASKIFQGECFVDEVEFELKDFADTVNTEGHTNVANSRALKRLLRLDFKSLKFNRANFRILRDMFQHERTVLKCLWIPTPSINNAEYLSRFTVFSKLVKIPTERHNVKGPDSDYVSMTVELDESQ